MEPVIVSANAQLTLNAAESTDVGARTDEPADQASDSFVACIVRIDHTAAEQLFRAARV